eukprot:CAMPEP_0195307206 /NCGR_PEP_ID=MMETSP0707-20130614/37600_1 /TAXON_ID=33640 /ORGANISM="Asterionellopsis glacialis, Strain CCMP134" /LENGTH=900 /DNA_ID=CAMNT_0040371453 /DNA_START=21 /DNA_END=2723 /DNA_ORIENTATION=-
MNENATDKDGDDSTVGTRMSSGLSYRNRSDASGIQIPGVQNHLSSPKLCTMAQDLDSVEPGFYDDVEIITIQSCDVNEDEDEILDHSPNKKIIRIPKSPAPKRIPRNDKYLNPKSPSAVFGNAREFVRPSRFFRYLTFLYSERKLVTLVLIHFVATMVIWTNFFLIKFNQQQNNVPEGAPFYWWKRLTPSIEFGAMHAILFQMLLIPLTMCKFSIAAASNTMLDRFIPFNRSTRIHIHLGYTWAIIVFSATILFFAFFGLLCSNGDQKVCDKFTSEIMITGYIIFGTCIIIAVSSMFRNKIPYEVFYGIHHLVFIMYAITTLHTLDGDKGRKDPSSRSQTFKWFSSTLLYYFCDRTAMFLNHRYITSIMQSRLVRSKRKGSRMIILKLERPSLFQFQPGQYAHLRLKEIDNHWHPFSIASDPSSEDLEFYIEVNDDQTWTGKLWNILAGKVDLNHSFQRLSRRAFLEFEMMGPYGTSLGNTEAYSHAIVVGSGTGIVPCLSQYKKHVRQMLRLDPEKYFSEQEEIHHLVLKMEKAKEESKGSLLGAALGVKSIASKEEMKKLSNSFHQKEPNAENAKEIRDKAKKAALPIFGVTFLMLLPVLGVTIMGFTISFNTLPFELYNGLVEILQAGTIIFQFFFLIVCTCFWDRNSFFTYIDICILFAAAFSNWFCFARELWGNFSDTHLIYYLLIHGYMTLRLWNSAVKPRHRSTRDEVVRNGIIAMDQLKFVWITRSATNVSKIAPDIIECYDALVAAWGEEHAKKVCRVSFFITDPDLEACHSLQSELAHTSLWRSGAFQFARPDIKAILEDHMLERIYDSNRPTSNTLLAFCGSPTLSQFISEAKLSVDISTMITGNKYHSMDFISESYGGYKTNPKKAKNDGVLLSPASQGSGEGEKLYI